MSAEVIFSYSFNKETILVTRKQIYLCDDFSHIRLGNTPRFVCFYVNGIYMGLTERRFCRLYLNNVIRVCFCKDDMVRIFCKIKGV